MTTVARRDYSLTGPALQQAEDAGLVSGRWYRPPIDREVLRMLNGRTNGRAAGEVVLWLALLVVSGLAAWRYRHSWWAVPCFAIYGALYGGAADARWHECGHGTAFKSRRANDVVYYIASFMMLREPTLWRWSHTRHHSSTIIVGRDPEIVFERPFRWRALAKAVVNLPGGLSMLRRIAHHAFSSVDAAAQQFVPQNRRRDVVWEARVFLGVLIGVLAWSIVARSLLPLLFVGLPTFYGVWLAVFFGITQHAGMRENVLDHRLNTRTVMMNPVFRFLYLNMNYHVEHHMFPTVPYRNLPALHAEIKDHLAPASPSTWAAYREIFTALSEQRRDGDWELLRNR